MKIINSEGKEFNIPKLNLGGWQVFYGKINHAEETIELISDDAEIETYPKKDNPTNIIIRRHSSIDDVIKTGKEYKYNLIFFMNDKVEIINSEVLKLFASDKTVIKQL